jgi:hypothetical protein
MKRALDSVMAEQISLGGALVSRATAARALTAQGLPAASVDRFAFGRPQVTPERAQEFRALCACGVRWQSVFPRALISCEFCENTR